MNEATAEKLIRAAAKGSSGGLRWVAWAISAAAKRRNTAKGRLAAKYWTYVTVILRNWKNGDGMPGEGWPGEGTAAPKKTQEAYSPWA